MQKEKGATVGHLYFLNLENKRSIGKGHWDIIDSGDTDYFIRFHNKMSKIKINLKKKI